MQMQDKKHIQSYLSIYKNWTVKSCHTVFNKRHSYELENIMLQQKGFVSIKNFIRFVSIKNFIHNLLFKTPQKRTCWRSCLCCFCVGNRIKCKSLPIDWQRVTRNFLNYHFLFILVLAWWPHSYYYLKFSMKNHDNQQRSWDQRNWERGPHQFLVFQSSINFNLRKQIEHLNITIVCGKSEIFSLLERFSVLLKPKNFQQTLSSEAHLKWVKKEINLFVATVVKNQRN